MDGVEAAAQGGGFEREQTEGAEQAPELGGEEEVPKEAGDEGEDGGPVKDLEGAAVEHGRREVQADGDEGQGAGQEEEEAELAGEGVHATLAGGGNGPLEEVVERAELRGAGDVEAGGGLIGKVGVHGGREAEAAELLVGEDEEAGEGEQPGSDGRGAAEKVCGAEAKEGGEVVDGRTGRGKEAPEQGVGEPGSGEDDDGEEEEEEELTRGRRGSGVAEGETEEDVGGGDRERGESEEKEQGPEVGGEEQAGADGQVGGLMEDGEHGEGERGDGELEPEPGEAGVRVGGAVSREEMGEQGEIEALAGMQESEGEGEEEEKHLGAAGRLRGSWLEGGAGAGKVGEVDAGLGDGCSGTWVGAGIVEEGYGKELAMADGGEGQRRA